MRAKDIEQYQVNRVRYLEWGTERSPSQLRRPTFKELYDFPKLLCNRLGELKVAIDEKGGLLHNDSIIACVPWHYFAGVDNKSITGNVKKFSSMSREEMEKLSGQVRLKYLLGVLNSSFAAVLLRDQRSGDYHIYPEHLRNIPIPPAIPEEQEEIVRLVDMILVKKSEEALAEIDRKVKLLYEKALK